MPLDPDTEIQYRRGGKIMKKTPRKFQAGGATPAPSPDRVPPAEAAKMKAEKDQQRREAATQKKGAERPNLGKLFKKGGAVRKFNEGGDVDWVPQTKYKNLGDFFRGKKMEEAKPAEAAPEAPRVRDRGDRFLAQTQAEREGQDAVNASKAADIPSFAEPSSYGSQAAQDAPQGIKGGENVVTEVKKEAPKAAAPKRVAPKAAPKAAPKKAMPESEFKRGFDQSNAEDARLKRLGKKSEAPKRAGATGSFDKKPEETDDTKLSLAERWAKPSSRRGSSASDIYPSLTGKKAGGVIKKYAKGGGVEAKGKTKGKIVKMAKGGSVKGWGIARGSRATKMV
jgi:hypothetical protein